MAVIDEAHPNTILERSHITFTTIKEGVAVGHCKVISASTVACFLSIRG